MRLIISNHARERWLQRFPGKDIHETIDAATLPLDDAEIAWIRMGSRSREHRDYLTSRGGRATFRKTPDGIIFVISPGGVIVTVFRQSRAVIHRIKKRTLNKLE